MSMHRNLKAAFLKVRYFLHLQSSSGFNSEYNSKLTYISGDCQFNRIHALLMGMAAQLKEASAVTCTQFHVSGDSLVRNLPCHLSLPSLRVCELVRDSAGNDKALTSPSFGHRKAVYKLRRPNTHSRCLHDIVWR